MLKSADLGNCPVCSKEYDEEGPTEDHWVRSCNGYAEDAEDDAPPLHELPVNWDGRTGQRLPDGYF